MLRRLVFNMFCIDSTSTILDVYTVLSNTLEHILYKRIAQYKTLSPTAPSCACASAHVCAVCSCVDSNTLTRFFSVENDYIRSQATTMGHSSRGTRKNWATCSSDVSNANETSSLNTVIDSVKQGPPSGAGLLLRRRARKWSDEAVPSGDALWRINNS